MALKGFSTKEWRRALTDPEEEEEETLQPHLSNLKINKEEDCGRWHIFTEEIFPRLPANQLQTFKIVCKNWYRIITNPYFVRLHLKIYNKESRTRVLILQNYGEPEMIEYNSNNSEYKQIQIPYPPEVEITQRANSTAAILGSCDGLICLYLRGIGPTFAMFNPSTPKCVWVLSSLKRYFFVSCSWFGRHPCSGEYVLVLGDLEREVGVYKFNRISHLQKIHSTPFPSGLHPYYVELNVGILVHGAVHWPAYRNRRHIISAYHLDSNKYFEISPPLQRDFKLGVAEGCLFAFSEPDYYAAGVFEMWIMKEYKLQRSWTKYANIHTDTGKLCLSSLSVLGFFTNANLILYPNYSGLIKYTFNDNKTLLLVNHFCRRFFGAIVCDDSLVSPKIVGT